MRNGVRGLSCRLVAIWLHFLAIGRHAHLALVRPVSPLQCDWSIYF